MSLEHLLLVGVNHQTCPVHLRETLSFSSDVIDDALMSLKKTSGADEAIILSTCNRTELYVFEVCESEIRKFLNGGEASSADRQSRL